MKADIRGERYAVKKNKRSIPLSMLFAIAAIFLIIYCVAEFISIQAQIEEQRAVLSDLENKKNELTIDNAELEGILDETDERLYIEKVAVENGYAYPNERRYYDSKG
jgi:predicted nuclease with TOPRIM domain